MSGISMGVVEILITTDNPSQKWNGIVGATCVFNFTYVTGDNGDLDYFAQICFGREVRRVLPL